MPKQTKFNLNWLNENLYPDFSGWLEQVEEEMTKAHCNVCKKSFSLSNMGIKALRTHAEGQTHKKLIKARDSESAKIMQNFLSESSTSKSAGQDQQLPRNSQSPPPVMISGFENQCNLSYVIVKNDVTKAEIYWAMTIIDKRFSLNSCSDITAIFQMMFPDSAIARQLTIAPTKAAYIINFGLAHYFEENLRDDLKNCEYICVSFDESLNKVTQKGQMDLHIRFWDDDHDVVSTRYLTSVFLGSATANDLLDHFLCGVSDIPLVKIIQVSMDGPNVNISFLKKLEAHMESCSIDKQFVQYGTCGLHTIHAAVKSGLKAVDWDVFSILRNLYYILKDSPKRRTDFATITGSKLFPKKFGATRWLENGVSR